MLVKQSQIEDLESRGYVHLKNFLNKDEILCLEQICDQASQKPSRFHLSKKSEEGEFFMDFNQWRKNEKIKQFCFKNKLVDTCKTLSASEKCWLMHEDIIIKNGTLAKNTPVHHDRPYFVFEGDKNVSIWMTSSDIPRESSLLMYEGSHKDERLFLPKNFVTDQDQEGLFGLTDEGFTPLTKEIVDSYREIDFDMSAGDAVVFYHRTLHASRAHSSDNARKSMVIRYLCDGATMTKQYYNNVPPYERQGLELIEGGAVPEDMFPRVG